MRKKLNNETITKILFRKPTRLASLVLYTQVFGSVVNNDQTQTEAHTKAHQEEARE
ncbi:hypothetical protein ccbrp13_21980 [Ktedonobacteria bacterium brp13]|nr:hypothetical protein ccbrp13_21980 [Ktedonobacteria bacterium brp13]